MRPDICVLIPCYNNQSGLERTCESLAKAEGKFDVLIVDDGSTPALTLREGAAGSHRVTIHRCVTNRGITKALNRGLEVAFEIGYPLIARLDSGDVILPHRLELQRELLEDDQELSLVGSFIDFCSTSGQRLFRYSPPTSREEIAERMRIENCLIHSGVMMRTSSIRKAGAYRSECATSEDYDLFLRMIRIGGAAIIPEALTICEHNERGISVVRRHRQQRERLSLQLRYFAPRVWASYYGVMRTVTAMLLPQAAVLAAKRMVLGTGQ